MIAFWLVCVLFLPSTPLFAFRSLHFPRLLPSTVLHLLNESTEGGSCINLDHVHNKSVPNLPLYVLPPPKNVDG